jgi:hypothetical protein
LEWLPIVLFEDFDCIEIQSTFYDPPALHPGQKRGVNVAPSGT